MKLIRALMHSISRIWDHPLAVQSFFLCLLPIFFVCFRVFLCVICFCVLLCIFLCKFCILHLLCCLWFCLFAPYFCDVIPPPYHSTPPNPQRACAGTRQAVYKAGQLVVCRCKLPSHPHIQTFIDKKVAPSSNSAEGPSELTLHDI